MHPFSLSSVFLNEERFRFNYYKEEIMKKIGFLGILALLATLTGCFYYGPCLNGSGPVINEERETGEFIGVTNTGSFDVYVSRADTFGVVVVAQENLVPIIETYVSGSTLIVKTENNACYRSSWPVKVHVTMPETESLSLTGSGKVIAGLVVETDVEISNSGSGKMEVDSVLSETLVVANGGSGSVDVEVIESTVVDVIQSGSGTIVCSTIYGTAEVNIKHSSSGRVGAQIPDGTLLDVVMNGTGRVELIGEAEVAEYSLNSSGKIDALDMMVSDVTATNTGSGNIYVWATDLLDATITGSGSIIYKGNPEISIRDTGSGSVRSY